MSLLRTRDQNERTVETALARSCLILLPGLLASLHVSSYVMLVAFGQTT